MAQQFRLVKYYNLRRYDIYNIYLYIDIYIQIYIFTLLGIIFTKYGWPYYIYTVKYYNVPRW